jgi:DNA modification methylase
MMIVFRRRHLHHVRQAFVSSSFSSIILLKQLRSRVIAPNSLYHADCLALLERMDDGVARTIYLDPPWFSQPFVATADTHSRVAGGLREYLDNFARVLQQCYRILGDNGSIVVHTERSLGQKFGLLLAQVFRGNHLDDYILPWFRSSQGTRHAALLHYGKSKTTLLNDVRRPILTGGREMNPDRDPRGPWTAVDLTIPMDRPQLQYEWRGVVPPSGRSWRYQVSELERLASDGRIHFPSGTQRPQLKAYLSERQGIPIGTVWDDVKPLIAGNNERVGYPTQQPLSLLERLIMRTSNPGELVLDPYCGTGTSLVAAHRLGRQWIGCDSLKEAVDQTRSRLVSEGLREGTNWTTCSSTELLSNDAKPVFLRRIVTMVEDLNAAEELIAEGESEFVERKISAYWNEVTGRKDENNKESVIRSVAAFLNSQDGGTVLIGVANDDRLPGLEDDYKAVNPRRPGRDTYELWLRQTLDGRFGKEFDAFIKVEFEEIADRDVCIVRIAAGNQPACNFNKLPIRRGNRTIDLSLADAIRYSRTRWPHLR